MARLHQRVAAVALLVLFAVAGAFAQGEVVILTDDTFEHQTQAFGADHRRWFVKSYAPWCGPLPPWPGRGPSSPRRWRAPA